MIFQIFRPRVKKYDPISFSENERWYHLIPAVKAISQTFNASATNQISKPYGLQRGYSNGPSIVPRMNKDDVRTTNITQ